MSLMDDDGVVSLQRQLVELAEHARAELQSRPSHKPVNPSERPTDEYGERVKGTGQVAPDWVGREVNAFLSMRLAFDRLASPEMRWAALQLQVALMNLLLAPVDWEYRQDQGADQHDVLITESVQEFEEALERFRSAT